MTDMACFAPYVMLLFVLVCSKLIFYSITTSLIVLIITPDNTRQPDLHYRGKPDIAVKPNNFWSSGSTAHFFF